MRRMTYMMGIIAAMALLLAAVVPDAQAARVPLQQGMEATVTFAADGKVKSGDYTAGDTLDIELAEPIIIGNQVIVEAGAPGKAVVVETKDNGAGGKPGFIKVEFLSLQTKGVFKTADGAAIDLDGMAEDEGNGKKLLSYILLYFFVKGGEGELDGNGEFPVTVAETVVLTDE